jgi:hypothetical protein
MKSIESTLSAYRKDKLLREFSEQERLNLTLKIPKAQAQLWKGIKAAHNLDEGFLEFVVGRLFTQTLFTFVRMSDDFAE